MTEVSRRSAILNLEQYGKGEPVLLVHGLGACTELWQNQISALSRVYHTFVMDVRGFGRSVLLEEKPSFTIEDLADDVAAICDHYGLRDINFVGTSMGGFIGQKLALANPGLCRTLTLCFTACRSGIPPEVVQSRVDALKSLSMSDFGAMVAGQALAQPASDDLVAWLAAMIGKNDPRTYSYYLQKIIAEFSACEEAEKIDVPTLVISGSNDRVIPGDLGRELHGYLPRSEFHLMEGVGHIGYAEQPEKFNDLLLAFLAKHNGEAGKFKPAAVGDVL